MTQKTRPRKRLTARQQEVRRLHDENLHPEDIAARLGISASGVYGHLRRMKLKPHTRANGNGNGAQANGTAEPTTEAIQQIKTLAGGATADLDIERRALQDKAAELEKQHGAMLARITAIDRDTKLLAQVEGIVASNGDTPNGV